MAENYIVNYQINVNSNPALESIRKFQQATAEMEALTKRFDIVAKSIGKVNSALASIKTKPINIQINTSAAEASLDRILTKLNNIKSQAKTALGKPLYSTSDIKKLNQAISSINGKTIEPKANTERAISSLDKLIQKIEQIKSNSKITIQPVPLAHLRGYLVAQLEIQLPLQHDRLEQDEVLICIHLLGKY